MRFDLSFLLLFVVAAPSALLAPQKKSPLGRFFSRSEETPTHAKAGGGYAAKSTKSLSARSLQLSKAHASKYDLATVRGAGTKKERHIAINPLIKAEMLVTQREEDAYTAAREADKRFRTSPEGLALRASKENIELETYMEQHNKAHEAYLTAQQRLDYHRQRPLFRGTLEEYRAEGKTLRENLKTTLAARYWQTKTAAQNIKEILEKHPELRKLHDAYDLKVFSRTETGVENYPVR